METESWIMSRGVQTSALSWAPLILDHELWKQDDITQNSLHPNITLIPRNEIEVTDGAGVVDTRDESNQREQNWKGASEQVPDMF